MSAALNQDIRYLTENEGDNEMTLKEGDIRYKASLLNFKEFISSNIKQMTGITQSHTNPPLYGLRYVEEYGEIVGLQGIGDEITSNGNCLFDSLLYIENDGPYKGSRDDRLEEVRQLRIELFIHAIDVGQKIEYTDIVRTRGKRSKEVHKRLNLEDAMGERTFVPAEIIKTFCDLKKKHIMLFTIYNSGTLNVDLYLNRTVPLEKVDFIILHHSHFTTLRRRPGFSQKKSSFFEKLCNESFTIFGGPPYLTYSELCSGTLVDESIFEDRILQIPIARRYSELYMGLFSRPLSFTIVDAKSGQENNNFQRLIQETGASNQSGQASFLEDPNPFDMNENNSLQLALQKSRELANAGDKGWGGRDVNHLSKFGIHSASAGFGPLPHNYKPGGTVNFRKKSRSQPQSNPINNDLRKILELSEETARQEEMQRTEQAERAERAERARIKREQMKRNASLARRLQNSNSRSNGKSVKFVPANASPNIMAEIHKAIEKENREFAKKIQINEQAERARIEREQLNRSVSLARKLNSSRLKSRLNAKNKSTKEKENRERENRERENRQMAEEIERSEREQMIRNASLVRRLQNRTNRSHAPTRRFRVSSIFNKHIPRVFSRIFRR